jgi:hypothetical protein
MRSPQVALTAVVVALVAGVAYWLLVSGPLAPLAPTRTLTDPAAIQRTAFGFVNNPYRDDYGMWRISGYLDNLSKTRIAKAYLEVQLADSSGNNKELVKYQVTDILPGARKSFDANAGSLSGPRKANATITRLEVTP